MAFTEKKFRALPFVNQAKKIADLLGECAALFDADARTKALDEIGRLQSLALDRGSGERPGANEVDDAPPKLPFEIADRSDSSAFARAVYSAYLFWRRRAGLGPEKEILRAFSAVRVSERNDFESGDASAGIPYSVWLHDIRSGYNVGAVLRTAECFGFRRVYLSGFTPGPEQAAVRSAAMGCEDWIQCVRLQRDGSNPDRPPESPALIALESANTMLPATARADAIAPYSEFDWPEQATIVVGNEELGVDPAILAEADAVLAIPMYGRKASLNLASSFAIAAARARECLERRPQR